MTNVLHVIDTGGPGGAETVFLNITTRLDRSRFTPICVISRDGWLGNALRSAGIEPLILPAKGSLNFDYLFKLTAIVRRHGIEVIVAHLYGSAIYCALAGMLSHTPVVSVLHGQSDIAGKGRFSAVKRLAVRAGSDRIVFVSEQLKDALKSALGLPEKKCVVIPNGVDTSRFEDAANDAIRRELNLSAGNILVGAIGNIRAPKSYDVLLRAAKILRDQSDRFKFVIAGEGSGALFSSLMALREELGLTDAVSFLGLRSDVPEVLGNLDVYVLSSSTEGFSIACIEAMAAGIPVVATRSGGPEQIIEDGVSGLLVPTQDPASLAAAITRIANDPSLAQNLTAHALTRVRERFTLQAMIQSYDRMLQNMGN